MYAISCELAGLDWAKIAIRDLHPGNRGILDITSDSDLDWFMAQHTRRLLPRSEE